MVFSLTISGVAKQLAAGSLTIRKVGNSRGTASFRLDSIDRSYRAAEDAEVIIEVDSVRRFAGVIERKPERGMFKGAHPGILTTVMAVDYHIYTEWRFVNESFPEQTLKQRLQTIIANYLGDYSVTLHGSQVDGPTLPAAEYQYVRLDSVLGDQMKLTADLGQPYTYEISYTKVLRAYQPSTNPAPFDLVGNDLPEVIGDIEVDPSNDGEANQIVVILTPKTEMARNETFVFGVDPYPYVLSYTLFGHRGYVTHETVFETLRLFGDPAAWTFDAVANTLTRDYGTPTAGQVTTINYDGTFSGVYTATDASWTSTPARRRQKVLKLESVPNGTTAQAFADAELAKSLTGPTTVRYKTWDGEGLEVGQSQLINVSARNVNATGVITEIVIRDMVHTLERQVTVIVDDAQTNLDRAWGDVYRLWAGDKSGGTAQMTVGGVAASGASPPFNSVQHNVNGSFNGDEHFTYSHVTNSIVCGLESSITATYHESCQVFGYNCHIADP